MSNSLKRILSVGQCVPDNNALRSFLTNNFAVEFDTAYQLDDTLQKLTNKSYDLILINRKLDIDYTDGTEIIKTLKEDQRFAHIPVMLITNFAEYQDQAVSIGAVRGFGKQQYFQPEAIAALQPILGS